jgi:UDP-N-acetyl-D-glucosamine dehydrogenase
MADNGFTYDLGVLGLGYAGLPLAVSAVQAGLQVIGLDKSTEKIERLRRGHSYVEDVGPEDLADVMSCGFAVTQNFDLLAKARAIAICVPTPPGGDRPDLGAVLEAGRAIGRRLQPGQLVVLESTARPGTTEELLGPLLRRESGLEPERQFYLAYSPERIDPANRSWNVRNIPKLVAGVGPISTAEAIRLYQRFCDIVVPVHGTREAELAKLLENTYRYVNIALVNELAILCRQLGIDIWEAVRAASTKPFGFQAFFPGPGVGGQCLPAASSFLLDEARRRFQRLQLLEVAEHINMRMPAYVVERAIELLQMRGGAMSGAKILLLGVAYKPGIADVRGSPALPIADELIRLGAGVSYADPLVKRFEVGGLDLPREGHALEAATDADLVVLITAHPQFDLEAIALKTRAFLDTRGVASPEFIERL